jgi:hypothetical protein
MSVTLLQQQEQQRPTAELVFVPGVAEWILVDWSAMSLNRHCTLDF